MFCQQSKTKELSVPSKDCSSKLSIEVKRGFPRKSVCNGELNQSPKWTCLIEDSSPFLISFEYMMNKKLCQWKVMQRQEKQTSVQSAASEQGLKSQQAAAQPWKGKCVGIMCCLSTFQSCRGNKTCTAT